MPEQDNNEAAAEVVRRSKGVLPKFKGTDADDVRRFVARVDAHMTQHNLTQKQTVDAVSDCLDGRAWDWFDNLQSKKTAGREVWTADAGAACLKALMLARYAKEMTPAQVAQAMTSLKMETGESVDDFLDRCEKLQFKIEGPTFPRDGNNKAGYDIMHEGAVKTLFINGLSQGLKNTTLTTAKGLGLKDYVDAARTAETSLKQVTKRVDEVNLQDQDESSDDESLRMPSRKDIARMYAAFCSLGEGWEASGREGKKGNETSEQQPSSNSRWGHSGGRGPQQAKGLDKYPCDQCWELGHQRERCPNEPRPYPGPATVATAKGAAAVVDSINVAAEGEAWPLVPRGELQQGFYMPGPW